MNVSVILGRAHITVQNFINLINTATASYKRWRCKLNKYINGHYLLEIL